MFSRERADVVAIAFPDGISRFYLGDFDGERDAFDAQLHGRAQDFLGALGAVQQQRLRAPLQAQRSNQSDDAEEVVGVEVGEEDLGQRKAHPVAHHLALGAFAAFEQQRLTLAVNCKTADVPFDCWPGGGCAEEGDG